jgi:hypothetical protein
MKRSCGGCTLCCRLLPVKEIGKPANTRCVHVRTGRGCRVHDKDGFPSSCRIWSCEWLGNPEVKTRRPDRAGYVIDMMPDSIWIGEDRVTGIEKVCLVVWVDPYRPDAWKDEPLLAYVEYLNVPMMLRYGSDRAMILIPPALADNGQWSLVESHLDRSTIPPKKNPEIRL